MFGKNLELRPLTMVLLGVEPGQRRRSLLGDSEARHAGGGSGRVNWSWCGESGLTSWCGEFGFTSWCGESGLTNWCGESDPTTVVGVVNRTSPVGVVNLTSPVGVVNLATVMNSGRVANSTIWFFLTCVLFRRGHHQLELEISPGGASVEDRTDLFIAFAARASSSKV